MERSTRLGLTAATLLAAALLVGEHGVFAQVATTARPVRLFPQFVGTWTLDEAASTGPMLMTPRVPVTLTIATTPTELTVTRRLRLAPQDRMSDSPPPEVYRLDGTETAIQDSRTGVALELTLRFTLVADMLALTSTEGSRGGIRFTRVTDALAVDGDVLTLHRQLTSMNPQGAIYVMQQPSNNFKHTFVYRRR